MQGFLDRIFVRLIKLGRLTVRWPDRTVRHYGGTNGPEAGMAFATSQAVRAFLLNPSLGMGECYMDESIQPLDCTIYELLDLLILNAEHDPRSHPMYRLQNLLDWSKRSISQWNPERRSRRNVAHHYDLDGTLYNLFLDADRQYSCAYFRRGDETLEQAQLAKKRHIAAKLRLDRPGLEVLDIGSGWGGMALTLAREYGAVVTGITLSTEQLHESRARAEAEGLSDRVRFELLDYRTLEQHFDRIVSVGMFEHVGIGHFNSFFDVVHRCLAPHGVALIHAIGRSDGPGSTNPWITKYIFPGGYSPALSEVLPAIERSGLIATDIEILRLHYATTLRHWRQRFAANRAAIVGLYDERFYRMFEFYLTGSELAFRRGGHMVFQLQLARDQEAVPLTRDYITEADRAFVPA